MTPINWQQIGPDDWKAEVGEKLWTDSNGRKVQITSMSDFWLNNIRKRFKGQDRKRIQPIMDEIKRRKTLRQTSG
jgi:hypothetical protein